jgi:chromosome segregation ATPase
MTPPPRHSETPPLRLLIELRESVKKTQSALNTIQERIDKLPLQPRPGGDLATVEKKLGEHTEEIKTIQARLARMPDPVDRRELGALRDDIRKIQNQPPRDLQRELGALRDDIRKIQNQLPRDLQRELGALRDDIRKIHERLQRR